MIKSLLQHKIFELCIDLFFATVNKNFKIPQIVGDFPKVPCPVDGDMFWDTISEEWTMIEFDDEKDDPVDIWVYDSELEAWLSTDDIYAIDDEIIEYLKSKQLKECGIIYA